MTKQQREQIRVDMLTGQLVDALIKKLSTTEKKINKSELYRSAVYRMAKEELTPEQFVQAIENALDHENI